MLWERFLKTGKIADYLAYKHFSEDAQDVYVGLLSDKGNACGREQQKDIRSH